MKEISPLVYSLNCKHFPQFVICLLTIAYNSLKHMYLFESLLSILFVNTLLSYFKEYLDREHSCSPCSLVPSAKQGNISSISMSYIE